MYLSTLRHAKVWQVFGRALAKPKLNYGLTRIPETPPGLRNDLSPTCAFPAHDPWNTRTEILAGKFTFLNVESDLGFPPRWTASDQTRLWQYNLHYLSYLPLLDRREQVYLCRNWVQQNRPSQGVGWFPYPTSLRIVNWARAMFHEEDLLASLYRQSAYLYRNVETYVYGNHLIENARALVLAAATFNGLGESDRWFTRAMRILAQQTEEQILPDGGHFERSPMYHALMLEAYLDVVNVISTDHPLREHLVRTASAMTDALLAMTHPGFRLALFNDATREIAVPVEDLLRYSECVLDRKPSAARSLDKTGYFRVDDDELCIIIDGGPIGPDYLTAHSHADIFSYEISLAGVPIVVDTGVFEYRAGEMRQYVRSTRAHNTVTIDGLDQAECWSSFRVARRYPPRSVQFEDDESQATFLGAYDGYSSLIGDNICHIRRIIVDRRLKRLTVEDEIRGSGEHLVESRIHLHPNVDVSKARDRLFFANGSTRCSLLFRDSPIEIESGIYCPQFGIRRNNRVVVLRQKTELPTCLSYSIEYS